MNFRPMQLGKSWRSNKSIEDDSGLEDYDLIQVGFIDDIGVWKKEDSGDCTKVEKYFNKNNVGNEIIYKTVDKFYDFDILHTKSNSIQRTASVSGGGHSPPYSIYNNSLTYVGINQPYVGTRRYSWQESSVITQVTLLYVDFHWASETVFISVLNGNGNTGGYSRWYSVQASPKNLGISWNSQGVLNISSLASHEWGTQVASPVYIST